MRARCRQPAAAGAPRRTCRPSSGSSAAQRVAVRARAPPGCGPCRRRPGSGRQPRRRGASGRAAAPAPGRRRAASPPRIPPGDRRARRPRPRLDGRRRSAAGTSRAPAAPAGSSMRNRSRSRSCADVADRIAVRDRAGRRAGVRPPVPRGRPDRASGRGARLARSGRAARATSLRLCRRRPGSAHWRSGRFEGPRRSGARSESPTGDPARLGRSSWACDEHAGAGLPRTHRSLVARGALQRFASSFGTPSAQSAGSERRIRWSGLVGDQIGGSTAGVNAGRPRPAAPRAGGRATAVHRGSLRGDELRQAGARDRGCRAGSRSPGTSGCGLPGRAACRACGGPATPRRAGSRGPRDTRGPRPWSAARRGGPRGRRWPPGGSAAATRSATGGRACRRA